MIQYALLQALNSDGLFSPSPFNLKLNNVRYHLPAPLPVSDYLAGLLSPTGPFRRLEHYCSTLGIEILRTQPDAFEPNRGYPTYAESKKSVRADQGVLAIHDIAVSTLAAAEIERFAIEGGIIVPEMADWIMQNCVFFQHCGGFVLSRLMYSFSTDETADIEQFADEIIICTEAKEPTENHPNFKMFRQMIEKTEARP